MRPCRRDRRDRSQQGPWQDCGLAPLSLALQLRLAHAVCSAGLACFPFSTVHFYHSEHINVGLIIGNIHKTQVTWVNKQSPAAV